MASALKLRLPFYKYLHADASLAFTNFTIDGTTDESAWVFMVEEAITITQVAIRINTITGTPGELTISLNSVDTSTGFPSATILGGGSPASVAIASPAASFTAGQIYWATLDNSYAAARGEYISIKADPTAGTWDASNSIVVTIAVAGFSNRPGIPYGLNAPAGTYARVTGYPVYGIRSTTDTQGNPMEALNSTTVDSGTNPNQVGFAFTLPSTWSDTYTVRGLIILLSRTTNSNQTYDVVLYSSNGTTELQTVTIDGDIFGTATSNNGYRACEFFFDETTLSTLSFGTKYYIFIRPNGASGDIIVNDFGVRQATDMQAFPLGENCFFATKVDTATAPSETTTRRPYVGLIIDDITEPTAGGGGLAANPARGFIA